MGQRLKSPRGSINYPKNRQQKEAYSAHVLCFTNCSYYLVLSHSPSDLWKLRYEPWKLLKAHHPSFSPSEDRADPYTVLPSRLPDSGPRENILGALLGCSDTQDYEKAHLGLWPHHTANPSNHPDDLSKQSPGPAALPSDLSVLLLHTSSTFSPFLQAQLHLSLSSIPPTSSSPCPVATHT